ncbi:MAG: hypothetical protein HQ596_08220, partial [Candidatus Saganbacteria bacterium]|nr:hypothetical protein [Candidatus Saganbacteria bacterium]
EQLYENRSHDVRKAAYWAAVKILEREGNATALKELLANLSTDYSQVRDDAAKALVMISARNNCLEELIDSEDPALIKALAGCFVAAA